MSDAATIGARVRAILAERRKQPPPGPPRTLRDLARAMGVSEAHLAHYLDGRRALEGAGGKVSVEALAAALGVDAGELRARD